MKMEEIEVIVLFLERCTDGMRWALTATDPTHFWIAQLA